MSDTDKQVSAILAAGGFTPMPQGEMRGLFCKETGGGWWMGGVHATGVYSKHTRISDATTDDPILAAQELVEHVSGRPTAEEIAKAHSDASDLAAYKGEGPFDPQPEASETPQHETHGETGEEAAAGVDPLFEQMGGDEHEQSDALHEGREPSPINEGADSLGDGEGSGGGFGAGLPQEDSESVIDADFTLDTIELIPPDPDPDFGAELLEFEQDTETKEEAPSGAFIFGDNIYQMRTAAIGLVVQAAIARMPATIDYAVLSEARNFAMGVAEGRWPDNPAAQAELAELEARERRRRAIETARDDKTAFLVAATREQIEAFDPESDWP